MTARRWRRLRQAAQYTALALFLVAWVSTTAHHPQRPWADLFLRLDPLVLVTSSLAGRTLVTGALLAGLVLLLTLLLGRVWCGWLCPLGTLLQWIAPRRRRGSAPPDAWRRAKYLLLGGALVAALLANQSLLVLDPITILERTLTIVAWPVLQHGVLAIEALLYRAQVLWPALDALHGSIVVPLLGNGKPVFGLAPWLALLFAGLVALNWWAPRFWCRYLCPLGAMLGLLSRMSLMRREVSGACSGCSACGAVCPTDTIDAHKGYRSDPAECIVCLDCVAACRPGAGRFVWRLRTWHPAEGQPYDPSRRQVLAAAGASAVAVALASVEPITLRQPATMIRPPGADRTAFSALCIRCAACIRVCPTQGLQPSLLEGGLQNLLTPRLVPRLGYCNYGCNACGGACPTAAIPKLALEEKQATPIGLASVDRNRCLPWAYGIACIVCEESCPIPDKAIQLEEVEVTGSPGERRLLQRPYVVRERCIGCGVCEYKCPLGGEAAIRVYAASQAGLPQGEASASP